MIRAAIVSYLIDGCLDLLDRRFTDRFSIHCSVPFNLLISGKRYRIRFDSVWLARCHLSGIWRDISPGDFYVITVNRRGYFHGVDVWYCNVVSERSSSILVRDFTLAEGMAISIEAL